MRSLKILPVVLDVNSHTGNLKGDDAGYRAKQVVECGDPLEIIPADILQIPVYAVGMTPKVCSYYGNGIGGDKRLVARKPIIDQLREMNELLRPYGRQVLVLDGFRFPEVQANLFTDLYNRAAVTLKLDNNSTDPVDILKLGLKADEIAAFASLDWEGSTLTALGEVMTNNIGQKLSTLATELNMPLDEVAKHYLTFLANTGRSPLPLSNKATTPHGTAASVDFITATLDGTPCMQGVPFDYAGPAAKIDFFEHPANWLLYREEVKNDPALQQYLQENGVTEITDELCISFRDERRFWFSVVEAVQWTFYISEPWHGNGHDGRSTPRTGNPCQAVLVGAEFACYGNEFAITAARKLLAA